MKKKLSYAYGSKEVPLLEITIGKMFDQVVEKYGEHEALVVTHQNIRWTYNDLKKQVDACAKALLAQEVKKGDRVGIWAQNRSEWMVVQYATAKIGAILVNINPSYRLHELKYALNQSGCKMLIAAHEFKYSKYTDMLYALLPELNYANPGQLRSEEVPGLKTIITLGNSSKPGMFTWAEFLENGTEVDDGLLTERQASLHYKEPINIQYTSGTTGFPKGATLSHYNILNNGFFVTESLQLTYKDRMIVPVPLYHCFGMVLGNLGAMTHGATVIYASEAFDPKAILEIADLEKATILYGVPTMFFAELDLPEVRQFDLSTLRGGIMAGALCPPELMKKVQTVMTMTDMQIAYGMTETSPVSTQTQSHTPFDKRVSTVGQVHPHLQVKIVDPATGETVERGVKGELCTRGYSVMIGYWQDEVKTKESIDEEGWMHSGDLATMDEEGYVNIVGRIKDMIIRGGENIYPKEIEEFLYLHPKVSEVQVIGVPSEKYGEEVMAWIKPKHGLTVTPEEIQAYCKGQIAHYKIPEHFKFTEEFPMTVTGKIRKVEMRKISVKELGIEMEDVLG
ncbi:MAG: AMP-binding protein [Saprospiraceae bacterium]|nr:AMP-binding protein [Saprospiraceae bacterium]MCB9323357.1 AMP-binding protein [Lewinellaceae bacterium]